ncbi:MAG: hypothetical protein ACK4TK_11950 [Thiobacillaceae bacterium]
MSRIHTFPRPEPLPDTRHVGERYSAEHERYDEGARYLYRHGAHELTLFWSNLTEAEVRGFRANPVEVGLYVQGPAAFLLYKIEAVCEWSDVAFNVHLIPAPERELPGEAAGDRARFRLILVDAGDGIIRAKRLVSLDRVMTQALRMTMQAQAAAPFDRAAYDAAVRAAHARFPDSDAMVQAAEFQEAALG